MISCSWKKFLSLCEGVAVLGTLARLANTYTALCTHTVRTASRRREHSPGGRGLESLELHGQEFSGRKAVLGSRARGPVQACAEEQVSTAARTSLPCRVSLGAGRMPVSFILS